MVEQLGAHVRRSKAAGDTTKPSSLADVIYWRLRDDISARIYDERGRLPGEMRLAEKYQVSRPVIRQVLSRLRSEGVISSRQGAGTFLLSRKKRIASSFGPMVSVADVQRCYEFRLAFEPEAAMLAAERADGDALGELAAIHERLKVDMHTGQYADDEDFKFHLAIAKAANNHYFPDLLRALADHISTCMQVGRRFLDGPNTRLPLLVAEHSAILDAISCRDGSAARACMRRHISNSLERMFGSHTLDLSLKD